MGNLWKIWATFLTISGHTAQDSYSVVMLTSGWFERLNFGDFNVCGRSFF